jgi:acetate kinase
MAASQGDERAQLALEVFAYRIRKYIGAYAAALEGLDALAFTGGIGQHSASMRSRICGGLQFLGLHLDEARNQTANGHSAMPVSAEGSPVPIWVIPTDEEQEIARSTYSQFRQM